MSEAPPDLGKHPRGTLAVVGLYAVIYVVGWFAIYLYIYLARGAVTR
jgi:hypothetical protein